MARTTPAQNPRGFASTTFLSPIHNPPFNGPGGEFQCTPQPSPQWRHGVTSNAFFPLAPIGERGPGVREHLGRTHFCTPSFGVPGPSAWYTHNRPSLHSGATNLPLRAPIINYLILCSSQRALLLSSSCSITVLAGSARLITLSSNLFPSSFRPILA